MTQKNKIKILILDDEKQLTEELSGFFQDSDFESFEANTVAEGKKILNKHVIDLLILDVRLPGANGLDVLKDVKVLYPALEVIIISAHGDMDTVIKALRQGAFDYLRKPFRFIDVQIALERTQKYLQMHRKLKQMEEKNSLISKSLENKIDRQFIGVSPQITEVFEQAMTAANYPDANVLITGESGTGKENIARIIHYSSTRKDHIFSAVNSSAITETLLESEFFGHKKGSFTGAITDKMGYFEVCHKGTLFLDEIADMPFNLQAKILRATEEKVVTRVGDTNLIPTDFRIISATNHDIEERVERKNFRLDLLHRLNTLHIHIPPLRERPEDIQPLIEHFIKVFSTKLNKPEICVDKKVFNVLTEYDFPGNVRELRNMTERAIMLCKGNLLGIDDFRVKSHKAEKTIPTDEIVNLKMNEINLIRKVLKSCDYNQQEAADTLGIHRDALSRKLKKYNININKTADVNSK
ncbi:MAG: sigma-54 dependent transcriptional regulator [Prolixibacteraceae bacterium]|jgi:DNA-binding NtrC family response regulator|nr:sigma-54 dependent transcriptional regulator [Prolixibacteraceae bacterium]